MTGSDDLGPQIASMSDRDLTVLLISDVKSLSATMKQIAEDTNKISHILYGNGEVGLLERVRVLESHPLLRADARIAERLAAVEANPSIINDVQDNLDKSDVKVAGLQKDFDRLISALKWLTTSIVGLIVLLGWEIVTGRVRLNYGP